jgi:DNA-binding NarL/FixJ family response regulator
MKKKMPAASRKLRLLLIDDHPIVRQGLSRLINQETDLTVCGEAADPLAGRQLAGSLKPDLAVVDLSLDNLSGIDLIKDFRTRFPKLPVLVLSMHKETLYAERVLRAGARGYIMKQEAPERVLFAIRKILKGDIYLSDDMASRLLHKLTDLKETVGTSLVSGLSDRELEVFQLLGRGHGSREIAESLHLSIKTVETYREHIKTKLQLANATQLMQTAFEWAKSEAMN